MKRLLAVLPAVVLAAAVLIVVGAPTATGQDTPGFAPAAVPGDDPAQRTSYAVGHALGAQARTGLSNDGMGVDTDLVARGFEDALAGRDPMVARDEMRRIRAAVHAEMERRRVQRLLADSPEYKALYDGNLERGRRFRELFAEKPGVVELPSGVQYLVVNPGQGRSPRPTDTVTVKVRAQLLNRDVLNDGTAPAELRVDTTIPGGVEILQLMSRGATWQVVLPPETAYGEGGRYPDIGPNETIVLTVELLEIRRSSGGTTR